MGPLTKDQTVKLKGLGILLIVLHNYFHNLPPPIGENEFFFADVNRANFFHALAQGPQEWPRALFSFLGHYGVTLFVLLSAYGLTRSHRDKKRPYWGYLSGRFERVYVSFVVCVGFYLLLWAARAILLGYTEPVPWRSLALKLTLISNFVPGEALAPVGPWWFFPFIFQVYAVFPLLAWIGRRPSLLLLVVTGSLLIESAFNARLMTLGLNINHTVLGHLPVICLGLYLASLDRVEIGWPALLCATAGFALGTFNRHLWLLSDVFAAVLLTAVPLAAARRQLVPCRMQRLLRFYGEISMPLFLVNGFLRSPFTDPAVAIGTWWIAILGGAMSLAFSTMVAVFLAGLDRGSRTLAGRIPFLRTANDRI